MRYRGVYERKPGSKVGRSRNAADASPASAARSYNNRTEAMSPSLIKVAPRVTSAAISVGDKPWFTENYGGAGEAVADDAFRVAW